MAQEYMQMNADDRYPKAVFRNGILEHEFKGDRPAPSTLDTPQGNICSECYGMGLKVSGIYLPWTERQNEDDVSCNPCTAWRVGKCHSPCAIIPCDRCNGTGIEPSSVDCEVCGDSGVIPMRMYPDSRVTCPRCVGVEWEVADGKEKEPDLVDCPRCNGEGRLPGTDTDWIVCPHCCGKRKVWGMTIDDPAHIDCDHCSGTGKFAEAVSCRHCGGTGKLEVAPDEPAECESPEGEMDAEPYYGANKVKSIMNEATEKACDSEKQKIQNTVEMWAAVKRNMQVCLSDMAKGIKLRMSDKADDHSGKVPTVREWKLKPPPPPDEPMEHESPQGVDRDGSVFRKLYFAHRDGCRVEVEWESGQVETGIVQSIHPLNDCFYQDGHERQIPGIVRVERTDTEASDKPVDLMGQLVVAKLKEALESELYISVHWENGNISMGFVDSIDDTTFRMKCRVISDRDIADVVSVELPSDVILDKLQDAVVGEYEVRIEWSTNNHIEYGVITHLDETTVEIAGHMRLCTGIVRVERVEEPEKMGKAAEEEMIERGILVSAHQKELFDAWERNGLLDELKKRLTDKCETCILKNADTTVTLDGMPPDMSLQAEMIWDTVVRGSAARVGTVENHPYLVGLICGATGCDSAEAALWTVVGIEETLAALQALWLKVHSQPEEKDKVGIPDEAVTFQDDQRTKLKAGG